MKERVKGQVAKHVQLLNFLLFYDTGASVIALRKIWASSRQNLGRGFGNNKGQTNLRRLIRVFVISLLESIISQLTSSQILIF